MARTISEIETALDNSITTAITNPSGSSFAEWKLWRSIFARAIWVFEGIMDVFKADIETTVQTKQPGSFDWYHEKILQFQGANDGTGNFQVDNLVILNGVIQYETPDPARQIIAQASLRATAGTLVVKVAKRLTESQYQPLSASEQIAFGLYLDNIKYPGTQTNVISMGADIIQYDIEIIYDPFFTVDTVRASVLAKMEEYRQSLGFDDRFYPARLIDKIMEATGVVSVKKNSVEGYSVSDTTVIDIDIVYQIEAGYFNYDHWEGNSTLTFTSFKAL